MAGTPKDRYHHGDLRNALVDAATAVARVGGPDAVVVRDVARQVGVSHNAAYRHFTSRDELLAAVAERGLEELARAMEDELERVAEELDPAARARTRLWSVGRGYVSYARREPGMFRTMWAHVPEAEADAGSDADVALTAYGLLVGALDDLVAVGVLDADRRPHAELVAWSAVHGLATLLIDGPLRSLADEEVEEAMARTFDIMQSGIG